METQTLEYSVGTEAIMQTARGCDYCGKQLPEKHFVSSYDGHYCDASCHTMYTED